jgi:iron-sulfur cluster assembly accessory protein
MKITEPAQAHLDGLLKDGELLEIGLVGGGCGGATVVLSKVELMSSDALSIGGTTNVIFADQTSQTYLNGGKLTLDEAAFNTGFVVEPPQHISSCGCGASIKIG